MAELYIQIDATEIVKWIRFGQESMFIAMSDFDELEKELNINKIDSEGDGEP